MGTITGSDLEKRLYGDSRLLHYDLFDKINFLGYITEGKRYLIIFRVVINLHDQRMFFSNCLTTSFDNPLALSIVPSM